MISIFTSLIQLTYNFIFKSFSISCILGYWDFECTARTHIIQCIYNLVVCFCYLKGCYFKSLKKNNSFCHSISAVTCFLLKSNQFQCQLKLLLSFMQHVPLVSMISVHGKHTCILINFLHTCYITFNMETSLV